MARSLLVGIAKDEGADIFEWILFHALIGFSRIVVFDNGSTDDTLREIARAARFCDVHAIHWPGPGQQLAAYQAALDRYGPRFDHLCFLDVDEFLFLYGQGRLPPFLNRLSAPAVAIAWRVFGSSGHATRPPGPVLETYRRCGPDDLATDRHVKSILRTGGTGAMPRMVTPHHADLPYVDALGQPVHWLASKPAGGKAERVLAPTVARIHHYHTKSAEDYQAKLRRGRATSGAAKSDNFAHHDRNEMEAPPFSPFHRRVLDQIRECDRQSRR